MEDDLTWLARNVHQWPGGDHQPWCYVYWKDGQREVSGNCITVIKPCVKMEVSDWLARRAELQNKPSWADAPEWAQWVAQDADGMWCWYKAKPATDYDDQEEIAWSLGPENLYVDDNRGSVLGDWRDTLELRPADSHAPAETKMMDKAIIDKFMGYAKKMPVSLSAVLSSEELHDLHHLCDAELTKRDAAVCGGQKYLDATWHERGELPPAGIECEARSRGDSWTRVRTIGLDSEGNMVVEFLEDVIPYHGNSDPCYFRPIRTERDKAIEDMKSHCPYHGSWDSVGRIYAEALYDAGYRKQEGA